MRDKWINEVLVEGYVFSIGGNGKLFEGTTGPESKRPNTDYISGTLNICTDDDGINIVPVRFTYVTEYYPKSGKPNDTYKVLSQIIDDDECWEKDGKDQAPQVRIDGDIEVNECTLWEKIDN